MMLGYYQGYYLEAQKGRDQSTSEAKRRQSDIIELLPASLDSGGVKEECNTTGF